MKNLQLPFIISTLVSMSLLSCGTVYKAPQGDNNAKVRIVATENSFVNKTGIKAEALDSKDCKKAKRSVIAFLASTPVLPTVPGSKHVDLGIIGGEGIELYRKQEFEVAPNKEFSFAIHRPFSGPSAPVGTVVIVPECVASYSFVPEAGEMYEIVYNYYSSGCNAVIKKLHKNKSDIESVKAENLSCTN